MSQDQMKSTATISTENAGRYMVQLCKHFGHKVPTTVGEREGRIASGAGEAALRASPDTLMLVVTAGEAADLARLEEGMASHLARFAFREPALNIDWRRAGGVQPGA